MAERKGKKRSHTGKSKKRGWKHIDVQDVEDYLEDRRLQERTGGLVAEKSDAQLFFVDKEVKPSTGEPVPKKRRRKEPRSLKCHEGLNSYPHIKPIVTKPEVKTKTNQKKNDTQRKAKLVKETVKDRTKQTLKTASQQADKVPSPRVIQYDLWGEEEPAPKTAVDTDIVDHYMTVTKKKPVKAPKTFNKKTSELPAVEVAHPGASYNPSFDDHQELLLEAHTLALIKEKQYARLKAVQRNQVSSAFLERISMEEMSAGLNPDDSESDESESDAYDDELLSTAPANKNKRKTLQQRKKERRRQLRELKLKRAKQEKIKNHQLSRLKQINRELDMVEKEKEEKAKKLAATKEKDKTRTKKLSYVKFEEPEPDLKLSDEIEGSLRKLRPVGHLLNDRLKSFQKRNILEPRKRVKRFRKYKKKSFENKTHKEITE